MKIHVEKIPACSVVYMRRVGAYGEQNFKLMQSMKDWLQSQNLWNDNGTIYAIAQDNPTVVPPEKCRYDVCYVTEKAIDDDLIHHGSLPMGGISCLPNSTYHPRRAMLLGVYRQYFSQ